MPGYWNSALRKDFAIAVFGAGMAYAGAAGHACRTEAVLERSDGTIAQLSQDKQIRDETIAKKNAIIRGKDEIITQQQKEIDERDEMIAHFSDGAKPCRPVKCDGAKPAPANAPEGNDIRMRLEDSENETVCAPPARLPVLSARR
jgi:hypothetical protein